MNSQTTMVELRLPVSLFLGIGLGFCLARTWAVAPVAKCTAKKAKAAAAAPPATARVEIEYCTGCRWLLRAAWAAQELLTTFQDQLAAVTLVPNTRRPGGTFEVRVNGTAVFSRKEEGRFPEMKELKQLVRDVVAPSQGLGHSDRK
jgi:selenoprotein W-related protein